MAENDTLTTPRIGRLDRLGRHVFSNGELVSRRREQLKRGELDHPLFMRPERRAGWREEPQE